jgi:hypothetical protein
MLCSNCSETDHLHSCHHQLPTHVPSFPLDSKSKAIQEGYGSFHIDMVSSTVTRPKSFLYGTLRSVVAYAT